MSIIENLRNSENLPFVIAHQGSSELAPENTIPSIRLAQSQGANAIEIDLRISLDHIIFCMHDIFVNRTTDGSGVGHKMKWKEINSLRIQMKEFPNFKDLMIPTLEDVFLTMSSAALFILELKYPSFTKTSHIEILVNLVEKYSLQNRVIINTFNKKILHVLDTVAPPFVYYQITVINPMMSNNYPVIGAWWPLLALNPNYPKVCHTKNQLFIPLDAKPEPRLRWYIRKQVDGVLSNNPQKTINCIQEIRT